MVNSPKLARVREVRLDLIPVELTRRAVEDIVVCEVLVEQAVVALRNGVLADANQTVGERLPIRVSHVDTIPR